MALGPQQALSISWAIGVLSCFSPVEGASSGEVVGHYQTTQRRRLGTKYSCIMNS